MLICKTGKGTFPAHMYSVPIAYSHPNVATLCACTWLCVYVGLLSFRRSCCNDQYIGPVLREATSVFCSAETLLFPVSVVYNETKMWFAVCSLLSRYITCGLCTRRNGVVTDGKTVTLFLQRLFFGCRRSTQWEMQRFVSLYKHWKYPINKAKYRNVVVVQYSILQKRKIL